MTAFILIPMACSTAVGVASLFGLRPIVAAYCLPATLATAWWLA